jgi:hypothetical protein
MDAIERAAYVSVGRACGFASLAILCFMVGLSYQPHLSARTGAVLTLVMTGTLIFRAGSAMARPYKQTETWLILEDPERPDPRLAQRLIGSALREAYLWYARCTAAVTVVLFTAAFILSYLSLR